MTKVAAAISALVALGLGTACVLLLQRQRDLEERIARLEKRPTASSRAPSAALPVEPEPVPAPRAPGPALPTAPEAARPDAPPPTVDPTVKDAVAREVERQLKERGGGGFFAGAVRMEDPIAVMEKELGLTPQQKARIADLWKRRDEELLKHFEVGPGAEDLREHAQKLQETETRYDAEIKRELDFAQAQKYDDLRKQGKLMGGNVVIQLQLEDKPAEKK